MFTALYIVGITAEAMTAALSAGRQKMDLFGVMLIAAITALGGGSVRDIVLGDYPLTWVEHPHYLVIVLVAAVVTVWMAFLMHYFRHLFLILDALGLAVFAVLGTQVALHLGHGFVIAAVCAIITGVFGGILRDLLCDRVPLVLSNELYASIAVFATAVYMALVHFEVAAEAAALTTVVVALVARLWAIYSHTNLPVFEYRGAEQPIDPRLRLSARLVRDGARAAKRKTAAVARLATPAHFPLKRQSPQRWDYNQDRNQVDGSRFGDGEANRDPKK
ncbi:trimeric intracellular cation channel family protein [Corynebacterium lizhenjunii]|uniref:Trimeric intracellular cation channel family protein n=1 Tax=Corynebacterium lizhenjunii TaxID=2709394 RepID=A0A7T0KFH6_9CORY|nr:trimeric intracellular cation channel family protein [Corynebacterium lizhenjunii]QPK78738.1 trimeric intracellular cation channel family protein [Corynebacterium lizhenjunii]